MQRVLDQFEAMTLGPSGPGQQHEVTADPAYYPRPTGAEAESAGAPPAAFLPGNCDARFMRLTVNAIPVQQVWVLSLLLATTVGLLRKRQRTGLAGVRLLEAVLAGTS